MKHKKVSLATARKESKRSPKVIILEDEETRQFFRYDCGKLVEYDLTKFNGKQVKLTREEKTAAEQEL